MKAHITKALISTAVVLGTIYVLRKVQFTRGVVDMALNG